MKKILIVDDDTDFRDVLAEVIKAEGFNVSSVGSQREALKSISSSKPDIAVVDYDLGTSNGYVVASEIINRLNSDIPIIIISAHEGKEKEAKKLFKYFFEKPIDFPEFFKVLKSL